MCSAISLIEPATAMEYPDHDRTDKTITLAAEIETLKKKEARYDSYLCHHDSPFIITKYYCHKSTKRE
jgi:hypothetical protein